MQRCFFFAVFSPTIIDAQDRMASVEYELIQNLTRNYDVSARPVQNPSDVITVEISAGLFSIADLVSSCLPKA